MLGKDGGDLTGVLETLEFDVGARLLDCVTNEFGGTGFSLGADNHGLLLLAGTVDYEGGALGFLSRVVLVLGEGRDTAGDVLSNLLSLDGGGEFGREGEVSE